MNSENSNTSDFNEEEMSKSSAPLGLAAAAIATGLVVAFASNKIMTWNDNRKSKKAAQTES